MPVICLAQYPFYFQITTEEGLPSNEVYNIIQDRNGFIWIGSDAGIYKFDGFRFIPFKSEQQKSKSLTGLCESTGGRIYCYSFKGQIFYVENDSLYELKHNLGKISSLKTDTKGNLWINHSKGLSKYAENENIWVTYTSKNWGLNEDNFTHNTQIAVNGTLSFLCSEGIVTLKENVFNLHKFSFEKYGYTAGNFYIISDQNDIWLISYKGDVLYKLSNGIFKKINSNNLSLALANKKISSMKVQNKQLWITTYSGLIIYDYKNDLAKLYYPNFSISNTLTDIEHNTWICTLQNGILRIPNFNYLVWNKETGTLEHDQLYKISNYGDFIFFATVDGYVSIFNLKNFSVKTFESENKGDIQQIYFDSISKRLYYTINNNLFYIENGKSQKLKPLFFPLKAMDRINNEYFLCSSFGTHIYSDLHETKYKTLTDEWSRNIKYNQHYQELWVGTNNGILKYKKDKGEWLLINKFLDSTQIISFTFSDNEKELYVITFKGEIFKILNDKTYKISSLPNDIQANQIKLFNNKLFCATNKGLWIYNIKQNTWKIVNKNDGLASENIQQLCIVNNNIWLASGNGLQKIPYNNKEFHKKAKVIVNKIFINGKEFSANDKIILNYNQSLCIKPEVISYKSNGKQKFAYRINSVDSNWSAIPGNTEQIDLLKLPSGNTSIELKAIDYKGEDSENTILFSAYIRPPFWQKWWFYLIIAISALSVSYLIFKKRIAVLQARQAKEIERLNLENELRLTQQAALKAQMNPHFIFNVLNSIKGYIYENDKKNATNYLSNFADLIRKILEMSNNSFINLDKELEALELYIKLEGMLLQNNFIYSIKVDENIDTNSTKIPALIIQPYVENAFKHGLSHKEGLKKLDILLLKPESNLLQIEIIDNGIGREASEKLNKKNNKKHESFAGTAIEKRINLLNHETEGIIGVQYFDLKSENNVSLGTKVVLKINI